MKTTKKYIFAFIFLLITEIIIALFVHDKIVRPFIGDIIVVILMYTFIRGIIKKPIKFLPLYLLSFACIVELAQYFSIVTVLHLQSNKVISTIIGTSYDIRDILSYMAGFVILVIWEKIEKSNSKTINRN